MRRDAALFALCLALSACSAPAGPTQGTEEPTPIVARLVATASGDPGGPAPAGDPAAPGPRGEEGGGGAKAGFVLRSPAVTDGGTLPKEYTGDGDSATLPLEWDGAPEGTASYAVIMHHIPPEGPTKWYWVLYGIPLTTRSLPRNVRGIGVLGNNSVNGRTEYAPPHSKGPGPKTYVYTVYALSAAPNLGVPPEKVSRDVLLAAMKDRILAAAELRVVYSRGGSAGGTSDSTGGGVSAMAGASSGILLLAGNTLIKVDGETLTIVKTLDLPPSRPEDRPREGEKGE
jgi:phosphatidylethanolamine-binding protein (PEBP) family uncharacterized protein